MHTFSGGGHGVCGGALKKQKKIRNLYKLKLLKLINVSPSRTINGSGVHGTLGNWRITTGGAVGHIIFWLFNKKNLEIKKVFNKFIYKYTLDWLWLDLVLVLDLVLNIWLILHDDIQYYWEFCLKFVDMDHY